MKVGDLVSVMNEWTRHNPWMKFEEDKRPLALVQKIEHLPNNVRVHLHNGEKHRQETLEVISENR